MTDILNEVMEQIRPLNDALTEKARVTHALRKLIAVIEGGEPRCRLDGMEADTVLEYIFAAAAEAKEALK